MVGLSDIPCVGKVVDKISDVAVLAMFRGLKYVFFYKSLVNDLNSKIGELDSEKERICRKVTEEKDNGKIIYDNVLTWQTNVEEIKRSGREFSPSYRCIQCLPIPNPVSRFRMGREAVKDAKLVIELTASGKELLNKEIAYLERPSEDVPNTNTTFEDFPSRKVAYGKLWEQLVSEDSLILGIYGMPGVGKTRMMEQIWKEAQGQEKKIFNKVTKAVVGSVKADVIKLQDQLASDLNCELTSKDNKKERANQLKHSMMNSGQILIIFDDVWGKISLYDIIGTSFDDGNCLKGCKILYTSRERSNCLINKCKHPVELTTLEDNEALNMFKNTIGTDQIVSLQDESLVKKVCKKCAGLPLVIHAVGNALKFKTRNLWEAALKKLEDSEIENIDGINQEVYACLKLSFDNLQGDAKQCLFLCSLFPADAIIDISTLIQLARGSRLIKGGIIGVCAMVDTLISSSLLLPDGEDGQNFKVHDIIRDAARIIAKKDYAFLIEKNDFRFHPGNSVDYTTGKVMHLELGKNNFRFPPDLLCPVLHTLMLQLEEWSYEVNIPKFSGGMFENLGSLVLNGFISPQRLCWLFSPKLRNLCIWNCDLPTPLNLAKLINLRKLEIYGKNNLRMVPNTISHLSRLKKLHLVDPSDVWETRIWSRRTRRTVMPKFKEIGKLTSLTSLKIFWSGYEPSHDISIIRNLRKFDIRVGVRVEPKYRPDSQASLTRLIELSGKQLEGFQGLVEIAEEVILRDTDVNINKLWNRNRESFQDLRNLYVEDCGTLEYLAKILPYEIQCIPLQGSSFSKLTILEIKSCHSMKYLFNNSIAECLVQLQELSISSCLEMEAIVMSEGTSDEYTISFSKLKSSKLTYLNRLKNFYRKKEDMHASSVSMTDNFAIPSLQSQPLFNGVVAFPSLEVLEISGLDDTVSDIWGKNYYNDGNMSSSFGNLESLKVSGCSGLKNVFQHSCLARGLIHLKEMRVSCCDITEIIGAGDQEEEIAHDSITLFPVLTNFEVLELPRLTSLWCSRSGEANIYKVGFPNLMKLTLEDLDINLESIEFGTDDSTCKLEYLSMNFDKEIQLPNSWQLRLNTLEILKLTGGLSDVLKSLCSFKRLKVLEVTELGCTALFSLSVLSSLQQLQKLEISNCSVLQEFVENARGDEASGIDKNTVTLSYLKSVSLKDLPNLKSFMHTADYELHMPGLEKMEVTNCGIPTLFTRSVIQKLQQLEVLEVRKCKLLEGIVADARGIETSTINDIVTLSQLYQIILVDLPNFKRFSLEVSYAFNIPQLRYFNLYECPRIEYFCSFNKSTRLLYAYSEWHDVGKEVQDLNDYIRQYRKNCDSPKHQPLEVSFFSFAWSCPWAC